MCVPVCLHTLRCRECSWQEWGYTLQPTTVPAQAPGCHHSLPVIQREWERHRKGGREEGEKLRGKEGREGGREKQRTEGDRQKAKMVGGERGRGREGKLEEREGDGQSKRREGGGGRLFSFFFSEA